MYVNDPDTTYELRVIDHDGLWFYVIVRNGRTPVEVSRPYGPVFPHTSKMDATEEGEQRLAVWLKIHETLLQEITTERWEFIQSVTDKGQP